MTITISSLYFTFLVFPSASSVFYDPSLQLADSFIRTKVIENLFLQRRQFESFEFLVRKRRADGSQSSSRTDATCKDVNAHYDQDKKQALKKSTSEFSFDDQLQNIVLLYVGTESPMLLVLSEDMQDSGLWRSSNSGKSFEEIGTSVLAKQADLKQDESLILYPNIFEHPKFKDYVIIFGWKLSSDGLQSLLFLSDDTAQSFVCHTLKFAASNSGMEIDFVWHRDDVNKILLNSDDSELFYSDNGGQTWTTVQSNVGSFDFRYPKDQTQQSPSSIFYLEYTSSHLAYDNINPSFNLIKYDLKKHEKEVIAKKVYGFGIEGDTLYASIGDSSDSTRSLHISLDGGLKWFRANLEHLVYDEFYSVLDTESEIMFVHVGSNEDGSEWGTLYISDSDMLVFTISLTNHAYIRRSQWNSQSLIDFYPVSGMKGTFITTVFKGDMDLFTMISFNRGASWTVPEVANASDCNNCRFLIYNQVAQYFNPNIIGNAPLSEVKAPGLILANAFYGRPEDDFHFLFPDLFLSKNGGYSWTKIREGPHIYEILDQGGMLAAVGIQNKNGERLLTNSISISFDEGACWLDIAFTEKEVLIIDILAEPTKSSTKLNIWAEIVDQSGASNWTVYTVDFSSILNVCDQDKDYNEWVPHSGNGQDGCLLGLKETFRRLKPESFCRNGGAFKGDAVVKEETCTCTQADWECNFGYSRPMGSQKCLPSSDKKFFDEICNENSYIEKVRFPAYRKVSGDKCEGGVFYEQEENTFTTQELCQGISSLDFVGKTEVFKSNQHHHKGATKMGPAYTFLLVSIGIIFFVISVGAVCYFGRRELTSVTLSYNVLTDDQEADYNSSFSNPGRGYSTNGCTDFTSQQESENTNGSTEFNLHVGNVNSSQQNLNRNGEVIRETDCQNVNIVSDDEPILA